MGLTARPAPVVSEEARARCPSVAKFAPGGDCTGMTSVKDIQQAVVNSISDMDPRPVRAHPIRNRSLYSLYAFQGKTQFTPGDYRAMTSDHHMQEAMTNSMATPQCDGPASLDASPEEEHSDSMPFEDADELFEDELPGGGQWAARAPRRGRYRRPCVSVRSHESTAHQ